MFFKFKEATNQRAVEAAKAGFRSSALTINLEKKVYRLKKLYAENTVSEAMVKRELVQESNPNSAKKNN